MKRIYVSGPYSKGDPAINTKNAIDVCNKLLDLGFAPFCPHLSHFWHIIHPHSWQTWMNYDLEYVNVCQCLLRIPGESTGGDIEVAQARALGMPVYFSIEELLEKEKP
jgi:hypothetical protein